MKERPSWIIYPGDCRVVMGCRADETVDAVVTDPPYGLEFMGKDWDRALPDPEVWRQALRVLKPGGHLMAFGAPRLYHRMACHIEDAGFELRDCLMWMFGSGFPKSLDVSKAIDGLHGAEREVVGISAGGFAGGTGQHAGQGGSYNYRLTHDKTIPATDDAKRWQGWGTALKPAYEPIILARKPLRGTVAANVLEHGTGAINVDGCRVEGAVPQGISSAPSSWKVTTERRQSNPHDAGRWPANVLHDGSPEVLRLFPGSGGDSPARFFYCAKASTSEREAGMEGEDQEWVDPTREEGSAGRDNPRAGAGRQGQRANAHPTVKPLDLMRWCVRLVTPPGGLVLDPFAGSGTTICAAVLENRNAIGIELSEDYCRIARQRVESWENSDQARQGDLFGA